MSLTPESPFPQAESRPPETPPPMPPPDGGPPVMPPEARPVLRRSWQSRLLTVCVAIFTFEVGLFLVMFPWMEETWRLNYFRSLSPELQDLWDQAAFRGALTGLGLVNIWLALRQVFGLWRR